MQTLPVDIIVSILSQDPSLLGIAHYLSKSIAIKARPIQLIKLIHNDPTHSETKLIASAIKGLCTKESPLSSRAYIHYSVVSLMHIRYNTTVRDNMYFSGHGGNVWAYDDDGVRRSLPIRADLYAVKKVYQHRGGHRVDAVALVQQNLDRFLLRTKTVADVIAIHAFLLMHMLILGYSVPKFTWEIRNFNAPSLCAHPFVLGQVGEWYDIVGASLA